tara:strand:+ start:300 stop:584 length:285 start_codon:yes stop_codon:yes gene_type:complete
LSIGLRQEDSIQIPLSGTMTKWEYMVIEILANAGHNTMIINGKDAAKKEIEVFESGRHNMLNKFGNEGWELIKIRGSHTPRENGREFLTFKRPV